MQSFSEDYCVVMPSPPARAIWWKKVSKISMGEMIDSQKKNLLEILNFSCITFHLLRKKKKERSCREWLRIFFPYVCLYPSWACVHRETHTYSDSCILKPYLACQTWKFGLHVIIHVLKLHCAYRIVHIMCLGIWYMKHFFFPVLWHFLDQYKLHISILKHILIAMHLCITISIKIVEFIHCKCKSILSI